MNISQIFKLGKGISDWSYRSASQLNNAKIELLKADGQCSFSLDTGQVLPYNSSYSDSKPQHETSYYVGKIACGVGKVLDGCLLVVGSGAVDLFTDGTTLSLI